MLRWPTRAALRASFRAVSLFPRKAYQQGFTSPAKEGLLLGSIFTQKGSVSVGLRLICKGKHTHVTRSQAHLQASAVVLLEDGEQPIVGVLSHTCSAEARQGT